MCWRWGSLSTSPSSAASPSRSPRRAR
uniref:Uncharacterized protein n=1 Tax=Arundo donax TaxID=35708 RepID=A0A0A8ZQY2_ARUDO